MVGVNEVPGDMTFQFRLKHDAAFLTYERVYQWLNLLFAILIPLVLLILMSIVIAWKLLYQMDRLVAR